MKTNRRNMASSLVPADSRSKRKIVLPGFRARLRRTYGDKIIPAAVMVDILAENKGRF
jgi:hypothetical protein